MIKSFSLAMMWGIFVGTYSSIFICSPILIYLGVRSEQRAEAKAGTPGGGGGSKKPPTGGKPTAPVAAE